MLKCKCGSEISQQCNKCGGSPDSSWNNAQFIFSGLIDICQNIIYDYLDSPEYDRDVVQGAIRHIDRNGDYSDTWDIDTLMHWVENVFDINELYEFVWYLNEGEL